MDNKLEKLAEEWHEEEGCYHNFIMINHKQAKCDCCGMLIDVN